MLKETNEVFGLDSYRHAKIYLEIGECYLNMNEREQGLNYVEEGGQRIKSIFGMGHSLY